MATAFGTAPLDPKYIGRAFDFWPVFWRKANWELEQPITLPNSNEDEIEP